MIEQLGFFGCDSFQPLARPPHITLLYTCLFSASSQITLFRTSFLRFSIAMKPIVPITPSTPLPKLAAESDSEPGSESPFNFAKAKALYTPGTMAKTAAFTSPFALFHQDSSRKTKCYDFNDDSGTEGSLVSQRLGIARPAYQSSDDDTSAASHRIGITRPSYDVPAGDIPLSPLNLYLEKQNSSPTPNLVLIGDDDSEGLASPWNFNLVQPAPSLSPHTSDEDKEEIDDGYDRLIHKHTADGHYLLNSAPLDAPMEGLRYSLNKGKSNMSPALRAATDSRLTYTKTRPVVTRCLSTPDAPSEDFAAFKVFVLLIQPKSKIFELIQIIYAPSKTTIGDILVMIPANSTEPALGAQAYAGLCRPKDGIEITDMNLMASSHNSEAKCAKITLGEILVAIPVGYTGLQCSTISNPILANSKIRKLLRRSDPLAPKRRKSSSKRQNGRVRESVSCVETVKEEDEEVSVESRDRRVEMNRAIEHAAFAAAAANAEVANDSEILLETIPETKNLQVDIPVEGKRAKKPIASVDVQLPLRRTSSFVDDSMDYSMSSLQSLSLQSQSLQSQSDSIRSALTFQSNSKRMPRRSTRRRHRRSQRKTYMLRLAAAALTFMIGRFVTDTERGQSPTDAVLGLLGLVQGLIIFLGLLKMQKQISKEVGRSDTKCPVAKLANDALDKYTSLYSNPIPDMSSGT